MFVRAVVLEVPGEEVELSDNFFDLIPGVKKKVRLRCAPERLEEVKDKLIVM